MSTIGDLLFSCICNSMIEGDRENLPPTTKEVIKTWFDGLLEDIDQHYELSNIIQEFDITFSQVTFTVNDEYGFIVTFEYNDTDPVVSITTQLDKRHGNISLALPLNSDTSSKNLIDNILIFIHNNTVKYITDNNGSSNISNGNNNIGNSSNSNGSNNNNDSNGSNNNQTG